MLNGKEPRIEPCGTPNNNYRHELQEFPTFV